jgi:hypothetical protein
MKRTITSLVISITAMIMPFLQAVFTCSVIAADTPTMVLMLIYKCKTMISDKRSHYINYDSCKYK